jgi:hypothetical protein
MSAIIIIHASPVLAAAAVAAAAVVFVVVTAVRAIDDDEGKKEITMIVSVVCSLLVSSYVTLSNDHPSLSLWVSNHGSIFREQVSYICLSH